MEWTFNDGGSSTAFMDFTFGNSDVDDWSLGVDAPLFEPITGDFPTDAFASDMELDAGHIDPSLLPSPSGHFDSGSFAPASKPTNLPWLPNLKIDLSINSRISYGQVTPPSSTTSSSPPLHTIDPSSVMPASEPRAVAAAAAANSEPSAPAALSTGITAPSTATITTKTTAPSEPVPRVKSKRGRKKKILGPAARDAQRARTLARNRAAAQRCRQRKKGEHAALEEKARALAKNRATLHALVSSLRDELLELKSTMLQHASCGDLDDGVAAYVQQQRAMLMAGDGRGESDATANESEPEMDILAELELNTDAEAGAEAEVEAEPDDASDNEADSNDDLASVDTVTLDSASLLEPARSQATSATSTARRLRSHQRRTARAG